jgi:TolA-binding protein
MSSSASARPAAPNRPSVTPVVAGPSSQRVAAVRAIEKPQTSDPGDDEYSYGFRLWDARFYPEAQQQLKLFLDKYPRHARVSFARNLMGRALLDDGKPREAATWFLQNYQTDKLGARAPDSLLYLAESMRQLKDKNRACIALGEFAEIYPTDANGRLKSLYDEVRRGTACN